jgi:hypothetical protein
MTVASSTALAAAGFILLGYSTTRASAVGDSRLGSVGNGSLLFRLVSRLNNSGGHCLFLVLRTVASSTALAAAGFILLGYSTTKASAVGGGRLGSEKSRSFLFRLIRDLLLHRTILSLVSGLINGGSYRLVLVLMTVAGGAALAAAGFILLGYSTTKAICFRHV